MHLILEAIAAIVGVLLLGALAIADVLDDLINWWSER